MLLGGASCVRRVPTNRASVSFVCRGVTVRPPTLERAAADRSEVAAIARRAAFVADVRPQLDRAYRLAGLLLGNGAEAEDAVGDALLSAWRAYGTLRAGDRFGGWFDRIVANVCRDRMRRRKVIRFIAIDVEREMVATDPFESVLDRDAVLRHIAMLSDDERTIVVLHYWADLRLEDVAAALGIPLGTVKSRLHRALERMRAAVPVDEVAP
jgi:RNA polymerase sigma factor (sigma-70 family)